jgi:adenylate cyclase class IV
VYLAGRTRIHLDRVDGLGDFVELEVVLGPEDDEQGGEAEAHAVFAKLGVDENDLVAVAYVDLLNTAGAA